MLIQNKLRKCWIDLIWKLPPENWVEINFDASRRIPTRSVSLEDY